MKIDITSFVIGSIWPVAVGSVAYLVGNHVRHRCKQEGCGSLKSMTHYRLLHLHTIPLTRDGRSTYLVIKLRECGNGHVTFTMKQKTFTADQIKWKPRQEFEWTSDLIEKLFQKAGIVNPGRDYLFGQAESKNPMPRIIPIDPNSTRPPVIKRHEPLFRKNIIL